MELYFSDVYKFQIASIKELQEKITLLNNEFEVNLTSNIYANISQIKDNTNDKNKPILFYNFFFDLSNLSDKISNRVKQIFTEDLIPD